MADFHPLLVDKRIVRRNINKGRIARRDFEKHLKDLPDVGDKAEVVSFEPPEPKGEGTGASEGE